MQFQQSSVKIHNLADVLSPQAYTELIRLIRNARDNAAYICDVVQDCHDVLEAEPQNIFLFFQLGQKLEELDRQIRLKQSKDMTVAQVEIIVQLLKDLGWLSLAEAWQLLKQQPDSMNFYHFSDHIQHLLSVD